MSNTGTIDVPSAPSTRASSRVGPPDPWFHWVFLGLSTTILLLSAFLTLAEGPSQVTIPWLNHPLPALCSMRRLFGIDCPGCGLTRSFISLAHGDWREALRFNPAGPLLFALVAFQIPYRALQIRRLQRGEREYELGRVGPGIFWLVLFALLLQWSLRNLAGVSFR